MTKKHTKQHHKHRHDGESKAIDLLARALDVAAAAAELRRRDHERLLEAIVATAVRVIDATAGSLMLMDEQGDALQFAVSVGPGAEEVRSLRVPLGEGIAGFVAATGQPLAIADTRQDARFARAIAEESGYVPRALLCVPLLLHERVIGVMELLDKRGGEPFGQNDLVVLGAFSDQAALAISLSQSAAALEHALSDALRDEQPGSIEPSEAQPHERAIALARQVATIAAGSERQAQLCAEVLAAVARYADGAPRSLHEDAAWI